MRPIGLHTFISKRPAPMPTADPLNRLYWPERRKPWYSDQRIHWLGWLTNHMARGTQSAQRVYDFIQCPPMLIWLADACGCPAELIREAAEAASRHSPKRQRECDAIRRLIPWAMIARHIEGTDAHV